MDVNRLIRPARPFTFSHLKIMWPFLAAGFYIGLKLVEISLPSAISEDDKRNSRLLKQLRDRGIYWNWYPEHTAPKGDHSAHH